MGNIWPLLIAMALQTAFAANASSATRNARLALAAITVVLAGVLVASGRPFGAIACVVGMTLCLSLLHKATEPREYSRNARRFGVAAVWVVAILGGYVVLGVLSLILQEQGPAGDAVFGIITIGYGGFIVLLLQRTRGRV